MGDIFKLWSHAWVFHTASEPEEWVLLGLLETSSGKKLQTEQHLLKLEQDRVEAVSPQCWLGGAGPRRLSLYLQFL